MSDAAAFRLYKTVHAATALTGDGAKKFGGRWNPPGVAVVYSSSSLALAQLETLVHLRGPLPPDGFESLELSIPADCIGKQITVEELENLCEDWRSFPSHLLLQEIGYEWITSATSAVMRVPSAVSPDEFNFLLNPAHADFARVTTEPPVPLVWDARLVELASGNREA
jgi:RES domain-containing protein